MWIGFDFDGTLVKMPTPRDYPRNYGPDIEPMVKFLKLCYEAGAECRIVTARGADPANRAIVLGWLDAHGLGQVPITDKKDFDMGCLIDDRAVSVRTDTGEFVVHRPWFEDLLRQSGIILKTDYDHDGNPRRPE